MVEILTINPFESGPETVNLHGNSNIVYWRLTGVAMWDKGEIDSISDLVKDGENDENHNDNCH